MLQDQLTYTAPTQLPTVPDVPGTAPGRSGAGPGRKAGPGSHRPSGDHPARGDDRGRPRLLATGTRPMG